MHANIQPEGAYATHKYRDIGIDGTYQFLGKRRHIASVYGSYLREDRTLDASYAGGAGADTPKGTLNQLRVSASYYYDKTYGVTLGLFDTHGDKDITLYGTRTGKPDTYGATLQVDWTPFGKEDSWGAPWANMRVGAQYTWYDKFNGASSNYDDSGRNASDNDTPFLPRGPPKYAPALLILILHYLPPAFLRFGGRGALTPADAAGDAGHGG